MHTLSDSTAQQLRGGQMKGNSAGLGHIRKAIKLGVRQMNLAINIIIGSGSISNTQVNLLDAGISL